MMEDHFDELFNEGIKPFRKSEREEIDPNDYYALLEASKHASELRNRREAIKCLDDALESDNTTDEQFANALFSRGVLLYSVGERDEAAWDIYRSVIFDPTQERISKAITLSQRNDNLLDEIGYYSEMVLLAGVPIQDYLPKIESMLAKEESKKSTEKWNPRKVIASFSKLLREHSDFSRDNERMYNIRGNLNKIFGFEKAAQKDFERANDEAIGIEGHYKKAHDIEERCKGFPKSYYSDLDRNKEIDKAIACYKKVLEMRVSEFDRCLENIERLEREKKGV